MNLENAVASTFEPYAQRAHMMGKEIAALLESGNMDPYSCALAAVHAQNQGAMLDRLETAVRDALRLPDGEPPADLEKAVADAFAPFYQQEIQGRERLRDILQNGAINAAMWEALDRTAGDRQQLLLAVDGTLRAMLDLPRTEYDLAHYPNIARWP